ncbi:hypothetical protein E3N88_43581 [Mikania micrantha]|uniref:Peptidase M24 domain-containing protein n=1 Tax=Mikania micrantha TaxID=192012 RepID=A0A5N6LGR2_9ASTR|nr:hypothetical protein E3N88_43581 [Mikania micrantha]
MLQRVVYPVLNAGRKPAHLQCPKCVELKLPREGASFWFVSVLACKVVINRIKRPWENNIASPSDGWLYCLRKGQSRPAQTPHFDWTGPLRPYPISKKRAIPSGIELPDWAVDGIPKIEPASDLQHVVEIAREVLDAAARVVRPGVTTDEIDAVVHEATIAPRMPFSNSVY